MRGPGVRVTQSAPFLGTFSGAFFFAIALRRPIMKSCFLSVLTAPVFVCLFLVILFILSLTINSSDPAIFFSTSGFCETITYTGYVLALCTALYYHRDFRQNKKDYLFFLILWGCALLREMGIQHYLTTTDTTAFKLRFFTNPNNPIHEKIISAFLLISVGYIVLYLLIKYTPKIIRGFFDLKPIYWTICTFGTIGIVSKFADRFPSNYHKSTGLILNSDTALIISLIEEGGEATLPLLFALTLIQYHYLRKKHSFIK